MTSGDILSWPDWAPRPDKQGYSYKPVKRSIATEMEVSGIERVEFDTDECDCTVRFLADGDELAFVEAFERDLLNQSSKWFLFPLLIGGAVQMHRVRLTDRPQISEPQGADWCWVSLSLRVGRRKLLCPEHVDILLEYSPVEVRKLADVLCTAVNATVAQCAQTMEHYL